jgi:capsular polysaccharide transport system permease protein
MSVEKNDSTKTEAVSAQGRGTGSVVKLKKVATEITEKSAARTRPKTRRRRLLALSFALLVALPALLGTYYFALVASDRYVSGAGFSVRGMDAGGGMDVLGAFTGLASTGSTTSDSYIVLKYLESRDLLDRLQKDFDLRGIYGAENIDYLSRMEPDLLIEEVIDYWEGMITTSYDSTSGIITFEVEAFDPVSAERVAKLVLQYVQELVNRLSEKARQDSVRFAESEVVRSETRLRDALQELRVFREQEQSINPAASAQLQIELIGALETQLVDIRARMAALGESIDQDAPSMSALRRQAEALEAQIAEKMKGLSNSSLQTKAGATLSGQLAEYESLEVEKEFGQGQQAYASALSSLEQARMEADRQQRYLAVYSYPSLPEEALYPRRVLSIVMLIVVLTSIWGIGTLIVYSVRDHLS